MSIFAIGLSYLLAVSKRKAEDSRSAEDSRCAVDLNKDADSKMIEDCSMMAKADEDTNHRGDLLKSEYAMMNGDLKEGKTRVLANESGWMAEMGKGFSYKKEECDAEVDVDVDGAMVSCDQEVVLKCDDTWRSTLNAIEFVLPHEEISVKEMSLMLEQGLMNSSDGQHGYNSENLKISVGMAEYLHLIVFERDGATYLSSILQNYIFDPGGRRTSALSSMT